MIRRSRQVMLFTSLALWGACKGVPPTPESGTPAAPSNTSPSGPPIPYEEIGACPFEGCVYRNWSVEERIDFHQDRSDSSPVIFSAQKGDTVRAITGVVTTIRPGKLAFRSGMWVMAGRDSIHGTTGDTLYLLTYRGEGFSVGWFKGRIYEDVEGSPGMIRGCNLDPASCPIIEVQQAQSVWWVRVDYRGERGWTREVDKLGNKDAFGHH